jgi:hypothetical protein
MSTLRRLLPLTGILAVAAVVICFAVIGETPDTDAPIKEITSFYTSHDSDLEAGGVVLMLAAFFFLLFANCLRTALRSGRGNEGDSAVALGSAGAIIFAVGMTIFAGLNFALGDLPEKLDPAALQALHVLSEDMFPPMAVGLLAFLLGTGAAIVKTGVLPKWLGWGAVVAGLFAFTPLWFVPFLGLAGLILISSVMLTVRGETA